MDEIPFTASSFRAFLAEGRLMGARCRTTGALFVPPRPMDPRTHATDMVWEALSGRGTLQAFTTIHIGATAMIEAGYDRTHPYCTGIVALAEGPLISAQILGVDADRPETIAIGLPVTAEFIIRGSEEAGQTVLAFRAAA